MARKDNTKGASIQEPRRIYSVGRSSSFLVRRDMSGLCKECHRLWGDYAWATKAHLKILSDQQIAAIQQDSGALATLNPLTQEASHRRATARKALKDHE